MVYWLLFKQKIWITLRVIRNYGRICKMNNIEQLIKKVALILGVSENMVMFNLSTEKQIEMLVEQYERLLEVIGGSLDD
jgi:hypothetical protein